MTTELTTIEKIEELRKWVLNDQDLYNEAKNAKELIDNYDYTEFQELEGAKHFSYKVARKAQIYINPSELNEIGQSVLNLIMRIDQ